MENAIRHKENIATRMTDFLVIFERLKLAGDVSLRSGNATRLNSWCQQLRAIPADRPDSVGLPESKLFNRQESNSLPHVSAKSKEVTSLSRPDPP